MTLPLRLIMEFLADTAAWLGALAAISIVASLLGLAFARNVGWRRLVGSGILGSLVGAALAHRIDLWDPLSVRIGGRDLPLLWAFVGAVVAVGVFVVCWRRIVEARGVGIAA